MGRRTDGKCKPASVCTPCRWYHRWRWRVVGFLPLVMVMYFLIALLEDCGYMARATVVLDPIFKRVGLSGKSVIPMVIGTGCAIPGVMSCRTIRNEKSAYHSDAYTIYAMWGKNPSDCSVCRCNLGGRMVGFSNHVSGRVFSSFAWSFTCEKDYRTKIQKIFFIIELPEYKLPSLKRACGSMLERGKTYIVKAGTIILVCNTIVQIMQSFN